MFTTVKGYHMLLIPYAMNPFSCATQMPKSAPGRLPLLEAVLLRQAASAFPAIGANTQESP
jgi:hypothetical protein